MSRSLLAVLLLATVLVAYVTADALGADGGDKDQQNRFANWMKKHNRKYNSNEFRQRFQNWKNHDDQINAHNSLGASYFLAHNKFSDLSQEEFEANALGAKIPSDARREAPTEEEINAPAKRIFGGDSRDFRGWMVPIQNQGQCGSCWAFSTAGAIEAHWAITGHGIVKVSEQQIVDCVTSASGCGGGWPASAINWVRDHGWASSGGSYPYTSGSNGQAGWCHDAADSGARVYTGAISAGSNLKYAIDTQGPLSVAVDASRWGSYGGGVFSCPGQSPGINHAVVVVGYGSDGVQEYWLIRNSWDTWWGEQGYMRLKADGGYGQDCGVTMYAYYAS